jgi:rare lipoprotein A
MARRLLAMTVLGLALGVGCAPRVARPPPGKTPPGYVGEGLASYYGPGLHGRRTASGERFDQEALTAAHRTAAFGTCLKVVNLENGRSVEVRVNDRGPFKDERVIDVSLAAARKLDLVKKGLARVRVLRCGAPVTQAISKRKRTRTG